MSSNNPPQFFCAATIKPLQSFFGELFNQQEPRIKENLEHRGPKNQREQRGKKINFFPAGLKTKGFLAFPAITEHMQWHFHRNLPTLSKQTSQNSKNVQKSAAKEVNDVHTTYENKRDSHNRLSLRCLTWSRLCFHQPD